MGCGAARAASSLDASLAERLAKGQSACSSPSFIAGESCSSLAFPFHPISNHAAGAFGFKALERELVDGLQPLPFSFLPPASDLAAEKTFHLVLRSVRPVLAESKAARLYVCERGI